MKRSTTFVVGAGASAEFDLPTGLKLTEQIASLLDFRFNDYGEYASGGDQRLFRTMRAISARRGQNGSAELEACQKIRDNMPLAPSIDNFLFTHKDSAIVTEVGKIAITAAIADAEHQSKLAYDFSRADRFDFTRLRGTWLTSLFQMMVSPGDFGSFSDALKRITFVCFNYDRCIERFFFLATKSYFGRSDHELEQALAHLRVLHPYGSLGSLKPRVRNSGFGERKEEFYLADQSKQIRTFTEETDESKRLEELRSAIYNAEDLVFLGFAFHPINTDLIRPERTRNFERILATGKGLSNESKIRVSQEIVDTYFPDPKEAFRNRVIIEETTCNDLLYAYQRYFLT